MFFFLNATSTTEIYTLSLHDALPISRGQSRQGQTRRRPRRGHHRKRTPGCGKIKTKRSEEHTSELQSHSDLVCRLLLEKKNSKQQSRRLPQKYAAAGAPSTGHRSRAG